MIIVLIIAVLSVGLSLISLILSLRNYKRNKEYYDKAIAKPIWYVSRMKNKEEYQWKMIEEYIKPKEESND